ncbi:MAG: MarR family winged helix-turn-helix transcriptional regulator [Frankiaceae bacterium]
MAATSTLQALPPAADRPTPSEADIELAGRLASAMVRLFRAGVRAKAHHAGTGRLDAAALPALVALSESGPSRASAVAEATLSDPSTVSRQIAHLVALGYIERRPDPEDRRAFLLAITPEGSAALAERRRARDEHLARVTSTWSERDRRRVAELVDRLATDVIDDLHRLHEPAGRRPFRRLEENQ